MSNSCLSLKHHQLSTSKQIQRAKGGGEKKLLLLPGVISIALYVLVGCSASYQIKGVRWFFFPHKDAKKIKNHTVCWWSCMTLHSAAALIEYWQLKLSSVSCSVYMIPPPLAPHNWFSWSLWSRVMFGSLRRREGFLKFDCVRHKDTWGTSGTVRSELLFFCPLSQRHNRHQHTKMCAANTLKKKVWRGSDSRRDDMLNYPGDV